MPEFPKYISDILKGGGVGVIPTDTIYGVVGSAMSPETVGRIYKLRKRNPKKPFIILIPSAAWLRRFGISLDRYRRGFLKEAWPGPVSVVLRIGAPRLAERYRYLHRGTKTLAFRVPASPGLRALLRRTGPLVAPSANWEGGKPAATVKEAQRFFGPDVDFYLDAGRISGKSSALVDLTGKEPVILRK